MDSSLVRKVEPLGLCSAVALLWVCPDETSKILTHLRVGRQLQDGNCHLKDLFAEFLLAIAEIRPEVST